MNTYSKTINHEAEVSEDRGFTLVEILIAIVLVGILSAVVVVGISNLTSKGSTSACAASLDAAKAGSAVYFTSNSAFPTTLTQLTTGTSSVPAALTLPSGVTINSAAVTTPVAAAAGMQASSGTSWYLTMTAGTNGAAPTFACN
jgi:prepilin-type N-terminal cleavage/methylation domain-containing protein